MRALSAFAICRQLLLISWLASSAYANEPTSMTWVLSDRPPGFIIKDGKPTTGQNDIYLKLIIARWPETEHRFVVMSIPRANSELRNGSQLCRPNLIPTPERETFAFFTLTHMQLPEEVIIRRDSASKVPLNVQGEVMLERLIQQPNLKGIVAAGRSHSPQIARLLAAHSKDSNIQTALSLPSNGGLFKLLQLVRADYTLDFEQEFLYHHDDGLINLPIAGAAMVPVGIACPRTAWGRVAVMKIDQLLSEVVADPRYRQAQERWISPESLRRYQSQLDDFYRLRARATDPARYTLSPVR
ncbi:TIGR02285 family protein [Chromobacterium haemolyticum]|uniref:TIGR02285 family protein n=1 Tax=Chromobacterium haemolyticum TaxID=394935 RepID=A0A1W0CTF2_9NEIS|nr:TIGR02285 family protein [Chromobacterium haemolyticum]OQS38045.1 hypothetical protein B0T45_13655 [Chromobacterium haemolyticum]